MRRPEWLGAPFMRALHERLIAEHGGRPGVRDQGLLESALARRPNLLAYGKPDLFDLAAAYGQGLVRDHPFIDGNKRAALMAAYVFLYRNGYRLAAPEAEAAIFVVDLAAGRLSEPEFAAWLRKCSTRLEGRRRKPPKG